MRWAAICVPVGTPSQPAVVEWLRRWGGFMRYASPNEGCGCCVDIYFVETLPDVLGELPPGAIVIDGRPSLDDLESKYCRCLVRNLSESERMLLENALDACDRLWDGEMLVTDARALYAATAEALRDTPHFAAFEPAVAELAVLIRSDLPAVEKWDRARGCTYDLRRYAARQLRWAEEGWAADAEPNVPLGPPTP